MKTLDLAKRWIVVSIIFLVLWLQSQLLQIYRLNENVNYQAGILSYI